jgi:hypothetical protein
MVSGSRVLWVDAHEDIRLAGDGEVGRRIGFGGGCIFPNLVPGGTEGGTLVRCEAGLVLIIADEKSPLLAVG